MPGKKYAEPSRNNASPPPQKPVLHTTLPKKQRTKRTRASRINDSPSTSRKGKELPIKKRSVWHAVRNDWMVKTLGRNDISAHLLLNRENVEEYITPFLDKLSEEELKGSGRPIDVWDTDINTECTLLLKRLNYDSNKTYIFTDTWRRDFVDKRGLKKGDQVAFCWDKDASRFNFSVNKSR